MTIQAWHFLANNLMRDGRVAPPDGEKLVHEGPLEMCASGLHASESILDALSYAPGLTLCRVRCDGEIQSGDDKIVCTERVILWRIDASVMRRVLIAFNYWCAERAKQHADAAARSAAYSAAHYAAYYAADAARYAAAAATSAATAAHYAADAAAASARYAAAHAAAAAAVAADAAYAASARYAAADAAYAANARYAAADAARFAERNLQLIELLRLIELARDAT